MMCPQAFWPPLPKRPHRILSLQSLTETECSPDARGTHDLVELIIQHGVSP